MCSINSEPLAKFIVRRLRRPRPLVVASWLWLAADPDEFGEKRRCVEAALELDPDNTTALLAVAALRLAKPDG